MMWNDIKIYKIINSTISSLSVQRKECLKPILQGQEKMLEVVEWMNEYQRIATKAIGNSYYKLVQVSILLYLFSPNSLAGEQISKNKRRMIANVLKCEPTYVSHVKKNILFLYEKDKIFKKDIDALLSYINVRIKNSVHEEPQMTARKDGEVGLGCGAR